MHNERRKKSLLSRVLNNDHYSGVVWYKGSYNLFALKWVYIDATHKLKWMINFRTHSKVLFIQ